MKTMNRACLLSSVVLTATVVGLLAASIGAEVKHPAVVPLVAYQFKGQYFFGTALATNFFSGPIWRPEHEDVPLSPKKALELALAQAPKLSQQSDKYVPREVSLKEYAGVWYYVVRIEVLQQTSIGHAPGGHVLIAVLLNGNVVLGEKVESR